MRWFLSHVTDCRNGGRGKARRVYILSVCMRCHTWFISVEKGTPSSYITRLKKEKEREKEKGRKHPRQTSHTLIIHHTTLSTQTLFHSLSPLPPTQLVEKLSRRLYGVTSKEGGGGGVVSEQLTRRFIFRQCRGVLVSVNFICTSRWKRERQGGRERPREQEGERERERERDGGRERARERERERERDSRRKNERERERK